jgi:hypothetical protein
MQVHKSRVNSATQLDECIFKLRLENGMIYYTAIGAFSNNERALVEIQDKIFVGSTMKTCEFLGLPWIIPSKLFHPSDAYINPVETNLLPDLPF